MSLKSKLAGIAMIIGMMASSNIAGAYDINKRATTFGIGAHLQCHGFSRGTSYYESQAVKDWLAGYVSGVNRELKDTRDITTGHYTEALGEIVEICYDHPRWTLEQAAHQWVMQTWPAIRDQETN
jgi:hypothetical protein